MKVYCCVNIYAIGEKYLLPTLTFYFGVEDERQLPLILLSPDWSLGCQETEMKACDWSARIL